MRISVGIEDVEDIVAGSGSGFGWDLEGFVLPDGPPAQRRRPLRGVYTGRLEGETALGLALFDG